MLCGTRMFVDSVSLTGMPGLREEVFTSVSLVPKTWSGTQLVLSIE